MNALNALFKSSLPAIEEQTSICSTRVFCARLICSVSVKSSVSAVVLMVCSGRLTEVAGELTGRLNRVLAELSRIVVAQSESPENLSAASLAHVEGVIQVDSAHSDAGGGAKVGAMVGAVVGAVVGAAAAHTFAASSHIVPASQSPGPSAHTVAASSPAAGQQQRRAPLDDAPHVDAEESWK